jgi:hypothetical protein
MSIPLLLKTRPIALGDGLVGCKMRYYQASEDGYP